MIALVFSMLAVNEVVQKGQMSVCVYVTYRVVFSWMSYSFRNSNKKAPMRGRGQPLLLQQKAQVTQQA